MNVEQYIKGKLDGRFFRLDLATGRVTEEEVSKDYIPDHKPHATWDIVSTDPNYLNNNCRPFSADEDDLLVKLRGAGERWEIITRRLKRAQRFVRARYAEVCFERGIEQYKTPGTPNRLTPEIKAQIVKMRELGMQYPEINQALGLGEYAARDYYQRYKKNLQAASLAA